MCGICGFTGSPAPETLAAMTRAITHRGPDEDGFFSDGRVNLGMRRLSIIDVETGQQPVYNETERICAVFNGEIYNFQELRRDLETAGHRFSTDHSDTEVIVHLYEEHGDRFAEFLNGMFAIALWDRERGRLLLVRDRMGVKPLFYTQVNGKLLFASEIKSLLRHPACPCEPDFGALSLYFTFKNVPAPKTAFRDIRSLLPGERLIVDTRGVTRERWWRVRFDEDSSCDENEAQERIRTILESATRLRMGAGVTLRGNTHTLCGG